MYVRGYYGFQIRPNSSLGETTERLKKVVAEAQKKSDLETGMISEDASCNGPNGLFTISSV